MDSISEDLKKLKLIREDLEGVVKYHFEIRELKPIVERYRRFLEGTDNLNSTYLGALREIELKFSMYQREKKSKKSIHSDDLKNWLRIDIDDAIDELNQKM